MFDPVLFVSLGPGDPELITLKGLKALQEADVVFCPATRSPSGETVSRASDILRALGISPDKIRTFEVPMSTDRSAAREAYGRVFEEIRMAYGEGKKIVLTAEGDAGFYSTVDYISDRLKEAGIPVFRIAGVPAFIACGALAGIPVTRQDERLEVIPGILTFPELAEKLDGNKTVVIMKPSRCEKILRQAIAAFDDADFHYFENAGVPGREFYSSDKKEIPERPFPYFSLLIIQKKPL